MNTEKIEFILIGPGPEMDTRLLMAEFKQHKVAVLMTTELPVMRITRRPEPPELVQIKACEYSPKRDKHSNQTWKKPWKR